MTLTGPLDGLHSLAGPYDLIYCDIWGVLHNGVSAYPGAAEALARYRGQGGAVVLVTNAPRPAASIVKMIDRMGVPRRAWDAVVTSGDVTRAMIAAYAGRVIHHVGPHTFDDALYHGLGITRGPAEEAEAVVVTDLDDDEPRPEAYAERMSLWLSLGLPMICANPDNVVEIGGQLVFTAGALADLYEEKGGVVRMAGKPYRPIYDEARRLLGIATSREFEHGRALAADFLFVSGSVHAGDFAGEGAPAPAEVEALLRPTGVRLVGYLDTLRW